MKEKGEINQNDLLMKALQCIEELKMKLENLKYEKSNLEKSMF